MQTEELPSVLVCVITCRRPAGLRRLLDKLTELVVTKSHFEILVVDNDAAGSARPVVDASAGKAGAPIIYELEPKPGIVFARNHCVATFLVSQHDALVFIDDDEWPAEPTWLDGLVSAWTERNPDIVTSHVVSVAEPGVPRWPLEILYGPCVLQPGDRVTKFYTNNLLLSRRVLTTIQPAFDERFAMTGASDYHFALKCNRAGFLAEYALAPVEEEFPGDRATVRWFVRRGFRSGIGHSRSHVFEEGCSLFRCALFFSRPSERGSVAFRWCAVR
jgi:succinoglycan biosynthesis protein ExoM